MDDKKGCHVRGSPFRMDHIALYIFPHSSIESRIGFNTSNIIYNLMQ